MNRCPVCRAPLDFHAVRPEKRDRATDVVVKTWERWDSCRCGTFIVSDGIGHIAAITREEPRPDYFRPAS